MSAYSYIHIALRGEIQGATRTLYSYPEVETEINPEWDTAMVEPEAAVKRFLNATECYVLQSAPVGHYISLITRDVLRPERGYLMISMLVENGCALSGRQVLAAFSSLKKALIEDDDYSPEGVEAALRAAGVPEQPVWLESWTYREDAAAPSAEAAYRTYMSVQELESIFSFPAQPEYDAYRCVLVVSATTSLRPGVKMPRITAPVRKQYTVVCPEGVTASAEQVYDGDRLTLTYSKDGFTSHTETVVIGSPAAYTKYDGSTIHIRPARHTGIRFVRRVTARVVSTKGLPLNGYTISVNGRSVNTMTSYIEFTEADLAEGAEVEIQAASTNYRPLKIRKTAAELMVATEIELPLQPVEQGVTLRLDFGETRVFEVNISIEKNTPEYNRLHSGNFHGFRAHRQVTSDNSEVYSVDLRHTTPPVAPNFERARAEASGVPAPQPEAQSKAPKFVNVSSEASDRRPAVDLSRPTVEKDSEPREERKPKPAPKPERISEPEFTDEDERDEDARPWWREKKLRMVVAAVAVIALAIGVFFMFAGGSADSNIDARHSATTGDSAAVAATTVAPPTPEEQADIDYLNGATVWELARLKSPMGVALAQAITDGNIQAITSNDYFAVRGRCANPKAVTVVDMLWRATGSPTERSNGRKLRAAVKEGSVDLHTLAESLAKCRPADGENTAPRPQK